MRTRCLVSVSLLLGVLSTGCFAFREDFPEGTGGGTGTGGEGGNGGTTNTGGAGGTTTTTTTTIPVECVPANKADAVSDECGVFVSSSLGDDGNEGSKAKPFATITAALQNAPGKTIYLCNETFTGEVGISAPTTIYGGLDCASDWIYAGDTARSTITADEDLIPVRVRNSGSLTAFNIKVIAADAKATGGSSIAILAEAGTSLDLSKSDAEAGNGAPGEDPMDVAGEAGAGQPGVAGGAACSASQVLGPEGPTNECGVGDDDSIGGPGGNGLQNSAAPGGPGEPGSETNDNGGGAENDMNNCGNGKVGTAGENGPPGAGASGSAGSLDAALGFVGVPGADGQPGKPGQGGGGGGGARGGTGATKCLNAASAGGASGGSGGSGGCGGLGGKGGGPGGASIVIVSLGATLTFADVTLLAKNGGTGGDGGDGQVGGDGGPGGNGGTVDVAMIDLNPACKGGTGGAGGKGGRGGGGLGGHSLGVAYKGTAPDTTGATITLGLPGEGGLGETMETNGQPGIVEDSKSF